MVSLNTMAQKSFNCYCLHSNYPDGTDETYIMWIEAQDWSNYGIYYTDEEKKNKKSVNDYKYPTFDGYYFEGFVDIYRYIYDNKDGQQVVLQPFDNSEYASIGDLPLLYRYPRLMYVRDRVKNYDGIIHIYGKWHKKYDTTDINQIENDTQTEEIYTIGGVKVKEITQSGLYIINGKKVFVKK